MNDRLEDTPFSVHQFKGAAISDKPFSEMTDDERYAAGYFKQWTGGPGVGFVLLVGRAYKKEDGTPHWTLAQTLLTPNETEAYFADAEMRHAFADKQAEAIEFCLSRMTATPPT